jgi:hypothetical protein
VADWSMFGDGQDHASAGVSAAAMIGTAVVGSGTQHTKGSWASLGATVGESGFLLVQVHGVNSWTPPGSPPSQVLSLLDIGFNTGTTSVVIPNLMVYHPASLVGQCNTALAAFRVHVPAGQTLYARCQSADGNPVTLQVSALTAMSGWGSSSGVQSVEAWGVSTGNSDGTTIPPANAPSWGSYVELTPASTVRADWLTVAVGCPGSFPSAGTTHNYLIEIAEGGMGSETTLFTNPATVNS